MRNTILSILLIISASDVFAQMGYVKLRTDSTLVGYLKFYTSSKDGHQGIELWRTKKDKEPVRIPKSKIDEYAIKKDTFKVFHQFRPFHDEQAYFEVIDAKLKSRGKVNLYLIVNYLNPNRVSNYTAGGVIPFMIDESLGNHNYIYILEDRTLGFLKALPFQTKKLKESLLEFFPEKYINKYSEVKKGIVYRSIPDLVKLYNSR